MIYTKVGRPLYPLPGDRVSDFLHYDGVDRLVSRIAEKKTKVV